MAINEKATASVELDGQQAENQLKELKSQAGSLLSELKKLKIANDPGYTAKKKEFDELNAKIKSANNSMFNLNATIRNLSGSSIKDLTRAQSILNAELRKNKRDTAEARAEFAKKAKQLQAVRAEMQKLNTEIKGTSANMSLLGNISNGFNKYFGMFAAFSASILGTVMGFKQIIQSFNDYEESVANLSAITGLQGEQLDWLSNRAKEASVSVTEHGIRFKNSAKEIVDAYTMVGSKRPELLANREALAAVTEEAMILSRAAKIELLPSATALTTVLNQFNEPADQARRIINALGAGSKVGAGNVEYMNAVIEKSGTSASGANLNIEQLIGTIQGIAPKFAEPAQAGTMLRNVFIRLQQLDDDLNPTIVGWDKALENLGARQYKTTELTKMFGLESFNMVKALIDGRQDIVKYTAAVTDSSVAIEQAAINSNTNAARLETARNKAMLLRMELGEKLAPALTFSTNGFSYLLKALKDVIDNWDHYRRILLLGIALLIAWRWEMAKATVANLTQNLTMQAGIGLRVKEAVLMQAAIIREAALAGWRVKGTVATKAATAAQRVFNAVVSQFPGFAIVAAIVAVIGAIRLWDKHSADAVRRQETHNRLMGENNTIMQKAAEMADAVASSMQKLNTLTVDEKKALYDLNNEKLRQLQIDLEQMKLNRQKAQENAATITMWQTMGIALKGAFLGTQYIANEATQSVIDNMGEAASAFDEGISQMQQSIDKLKGSNQDLVNIMTAEARANAIVGDSIQALEEKINLYNLALRNAVIGSDEYNRIKNAITETQRTLNAVMESAATPVNEQTSAYQQLTKAISDAKAQLEALVSLGMFDQAKEVGLTIKALEQEKSILDKIIAAGGDINQFLDDLTDGEAAALEEMNAASAAFLDTWGQQAARYEEDRQRQRAEELEWQDLQTTSALEYEEWLSQMKIEKAQQTQDAIRQITDAALQEAFNTYSAYSYARQDRELKELQDSKAARLKNTNLTEKQRADIEEYYRKEEAKVKLQAWKRQRNADIIQASINTILAVSRALAAPPGFPLNLPSVITAGVLGGIQIAAVAAQPVPQFAKGRYLPVMGASDGRVYNAQLAGAPKTGIYARPALISETGGELIVDAPTTRNLQLNYPEIINGIMAARVPQYADGRYPAVQQTQPAPMAGTAQTAATIARLDQVISQATVVMSALVQLLSKPIRANISLFDLDKASSDRDQAENDTSF